MSDTEDVGAMLEEESVVTSGETSTEVVVTQSAHK